ncbi:hypothetical protein ACN28S_42260 [Cystobacter fuscus]
MQLDVQREPRGIQPRGHPGLRQQWRQRTEGRKVALDVTAKRAGFPVERQCGIESDLRPRVAREPQPERRLSAIEVQRQGLVLRTRIVLTHAQPFDSKIQLALVPPDISSRMHHDGEIAGRHVVPSRPLQAQLRAVLQAWRGGKERRQLARGGRVHGR